MTEHVLDYDHSVVPQETPWDCGPASTQVVLNGRGVIRSETEIIGQVNAAHPDHLIDEDGTDYVGLLADALNALLPEANYQSVYMPDDPPTQAQKDQLWTDLKRSIDAGYGVVMNWVVPPGNRPIPAHGSVGPRYPGGFTTFHYVSCMGYGDTPDARAVWIADSGFAPFGYWISFDQCATLIPDKGYCFANAAPIEPDPTPEPEPAPEPEPNPQPDGVIEPPQLAPGLLPILFADVSEYQVPVDDSYPYEILSIRVCDGDYRDHNFAANYDWMRRALDTGRLKMGIVYTYVRPNWEDNANTVRAMIDAAGGLHERVALMLDVESGGNPPGDGSDWINRLYWNLVDYAGSAPRVIGYANAGDFEKLWVTRPPGIRVVGAGYPTNPNLPGQVAHQYTNGEGYGAPLPQGAAPFGNCDMNSAATLSVEDFAALCGIGAKPAATPNPTGALMALTDTEQQEVLTKVRDIWDQLRGPGGGGWAQLGQNAEGDNLTPVDAIANIGTAIPGLASNAAQACAAAMAADLDQMKQDIAALKEGGK